MSISAQFNESGRGPGVPTLLPGEPGYDDNRHDPNNLFRVNQNVSPARVMPD